jgi:hypothetical protein
MCALPAGSGQRHGDSGKLSEGQPIWPALLAEDHPLTAR